MSAEKFQPGEEKMLRLDVERQSGGRIIIHGPQDSEFAFGHDGKGDVVLTSQPIRNPLSRSEMAAVYQKAREALSTSNPAQVE